VTAPKKHPTRSTDVQGRKALAVTARIAEAEAEIARINGIIADRTALALRSVQRDPTQPPSSQGSAPVLQSALQRAGRLAEASSHYDEAAGLIWSHRF